MLEIRGALRQVDAAKQAGLTQSKISRAEQGSYTLSPADARTYATALGATAAQRDELIALCTAVEPKTVMGQVRLMRRGAEIQRRIRDLERQSALVRAWQPTMIPGALQTWDYTVALIEFEPDQRWAAERRSRIALLDDPQREFRFVVSEAALRWVVGSAEVMDAALRHVSELSERSNVTVGVVPFGQTTMPPPESSFGMFGDRAVVVSTDAGTTFLTDRGDIEGFAATFERLMGVAAHDGDARQLIARAREAL